MDFWVKQLLEANKDLIRGRLSVEEADIKPSEAYRLIGRALIADANKISGVEADLWAILDRGKWSVAYRKTSSDGFDVWWTVNSDTWICEFGDEQEAHPITPSQPQKGEK